MGKAACIPRKIRPQGVNPNWSVETVPSSAFPGPVVDQFSPNGFVETSQ